MNSPVGRIQVKVKVEVEADEKHTAACRKGPAIRKAPQNSRVMEAPGTKHQTLNTEMPSTARGRGVSC